MGSERGVEGGGGSAGNLGLVLEEEGLFLHLDVSLLGTRVFVLLC